MAHRALAEEKGKEIINSKTLYVMKWPIIGIVISLVLILVGFLGDSTRLTMAGVVFLMCNVGVIIGIKLKQKEQ